MPEPDLSPNSRESKGGRFFTRALLAAITTFAGIQYSLHHGRLLRRPVADDANYFVDGLQRLLTFYEKGAWGVIHSLIANPPHAPFSSLLAMAAFAIFGWHDWAPYAGNGIVVLALLTAVDWLGGNIRPWQRGLLYALVLSSRWPWTAVTEFRPDLAAGLGIAVAIIFCLRSPLAGSSMRHQITVGAFFGLAMVLKPSLAPVNCVLFVACIAVAIGIDFAMRSKLALRPIGMTILGALIVALPYYLFGWRTTYEYIYANVFGNRKEIWQQPESLGQTLSYYLIRKDYAGSLILGVGHVYLLIALAVIGMVLAFCCGTRLQKFRAAGFALIGLIAYAIPTIAKTKNFYFGAGFQTLLFLGAVLTLRKLLSLKKCAATAAFVAACVAGICMFHPPYYRADAWSESVVQSNRLLGEVYSTVQHGQIGDRIFIPAPGGSVSWNTMNYLSLCDKSLRRFSNLDYGTWDDRDAIKAELDLADWAVAGDPGNSEARAVFKDTPLAEKLYLDSIRARPAFVEVASFPTSDGLKYHVFQRKTPAFFGFVENESTGLRGLDVPHPEWLIPATRAESEEITRLSLPVGASERTLVLSFKCRIDGQEITINLDGKDIQSGRFDKSESFCDMRVPLTVGPGTHRLEIHYKKSDKTGGREPVVLFRKIQILGPND